VGLGKEQLVDGTGARLSIASATRWPRAIDDSSTTASAGPIA
jgi:hypothetical protein